MQTPQSVVVAAILEITQGASLINQTLQFNVFFFIKYTNLSSKKA